MEALITLIALAAGLTGAVALRLRSSGWAKMKRARRVPVARAKAGAVVKLVGHIRYLDRPLAAPLSGRPCACHQVRVWHLREQGWEQVVFAHGHVLRFLLEDESGTAVIEARSLELQLDIDARTQLASRSYRDVTPEMEAFLAARRVALPPWELRTNLLYLEGILAEGSLVAVQGRCQMVPDPAGAGYRDLPLRPCLCADGSTPLLASDQPALLAR